MSETYRKLPYYTYWPLQICLGRKFATFLKDSFASRQQNRTGSNIGGKKHGLKRGRCWKVALPRRGSPGLAQQKMF